MDIAGSAYCYRADARREENPPESWILLMQYAGLPHDQPVDVKAPSVRRSLWAVVGGSAAGATGGVIVACGCQAPAVARTDRAALLRCHGQHRAYVVESSDDQRKPASPKYRPTDARHLYTIPVDTWGVVAAVRGEKEASGFAIPAVRAWVPDVWKKMDLEIEWGFDTATATLAYDGRIEAYDGIVSEVKPLAGDTGTVTTGPQAWRSAGQGDTRRGVQLSVLYQGTSRWRRVWPYHAQPEDVARTILTVWTKSGSFSFQVSDLEQGPLLAPEYGFLVRATARQEAAKSPVIPANPDDSAKQTLGEKINELPGVPKVRGWAANGIPWFGVNSSTEAGRDQNLKVPARSVAMHPVPDRDVAVSWRSPIQGRVSVKGPRGHGETRPAERYPVVHHARGENGPTSAGARGG